jgi:hypothetical protein
MSTTFHYGRIAPDSVDPTNSTGNYPGYLFEIAENDGGIIIQTSDRDNENSALRENCKAIFVGITEAEEIMEGLKNAIASARSKGSDSHSGRVCDP